MAEELKLPQETLDRLREHEELAIEAEKFLGKAVRAGLNVGNRPEVLAKQREQIRGIRDNFFPGTTLR